MHELTMWSDSRSIFQVRCLAYTSSSMKQVKKPLLPYSKVKRNSNPPDMKYSGKWGREIMFQD